MADVSFAAAATGSTHDIYPYGAAGVALTGCMAVYFDGTQLLKCNTDTAAKAACVGLVGQNTTSIGQYPVIWGNGTLISGLSGITRGVAYYVSGTGGTHAGGAAGGICLVSELTTDEYVTIVGYGVSSSTFRVQIMQMGVAL